jgi:hypothetical protein
MVVGHAKLGKTQRVFGLLRAGWTVDELQFQSILCASEVAILCSVHL